MSLFTGREREDRRAKLGVPLVGVARHVFLKERGLAPFENGSLAASAAKRCWNVESRVTLHC
jgi:hypothetical protein